MPTILIVEDNPLNLELQTDLLEMQGITVLQAQNAEEGISIAKEQRPDLILMDVSLPGIDGLEAARILKAENATAHIPIVAVTAHAMPSDLEKIGHAGCTAALTKPIDTRTFVQQVLSYLNRG